MPGSHTRSTKLAPDYLLNLSKTDLADMLWGVAQQVSPGEELERLVEEAETQASAGDKPMARAHKYLAEINAKLNAGHAERCYKPKKKHPYIVPGFHVGADGYACPPYCRLHPSQADKAPAAPPAPTHETSTCPSCTRRVECGGPCTKTPDNLGHMCVECSKAENQRDQENHAVNPEPRDFGAGPNPYGYLPLVVA